MTFFPFKKWIWSSTLAKLQPTMRKYSWHASHRFNTKKILLAAAVTVTFLSGLSFHINANESSFRFEQPYISEIRGNFCVKCNPPIGQFNVVQWEQSPDGPDIPVTWDLGKETGFHPAGDRALSQIGIHNVSGSSGAQMQGNTVGAFINSADFPTGTHANKVITTPNITFKENVRPFERDNVLNVSFDLQVPVAHDGNTQQSSTYVVSDLTFYDTVSKQSVYVNVMVFKNNLRKPAEFVFFDVDTKMAAALSVANHNAIYCTLASNSEVFQNQPWVGWKSFSYRITKGNFSADPSTWILKRWHLNAELLFDSGSAEMGWSMSGLLITTSSPAL
jgi:hypothetical protein